MGRTIHRVWIDLDHPGHGLTQYREQFPRRRFPPEVSPDNARAAWEEEVELHLTELWTLISGPLAEARKLGKPMRGLSA